MIKFSELKQKLLEDSESPYGNRARVNSIGNDGAIDDVPLFDIAHPETIMRLNAYLLSSTKEATADPYTLLKHLQRKLFIVGLQFHLTPGRNGGMGSKSKYIQSKATGDTMGFPAVNGEWEELYPLSYMGGRFGVLDNSYKIGYDDNISHRVGHGLRLRVRYLLSSMSGLVTVTPKIEPFVQQADPPSTTDDEK